jgi:hypothetical protein
MAVCVKSEELPGGGFAALWRVDGRRRRWFKVSGVFPNKVEAELAATKVWHVEREARIARDRAKREQQAQRARWAARRREQRQ